VRDAVAEAQGQFGNPEEEECLPFRSHYQRTGEDTAD
jgi:hypothetical protein